jgi:hypothetical protein
MRGFFEDSQGKRSMGRLLAFAGVTVGGVVALAGLCGWFCGLSEAPRVVLYGVLSAGGGEGLKLVQKFAERKYG